MADERTPATVALAPQAEVAERVLLPGDPRRALAVAQAELEQPPAMLNHNRGLWGYTGMAPDGAPLTVQSSGMGGPSAAMVVEELVRLGARRVIRIGTCGSLVEDLQLGALVVATEVVGSDGTSAALGAPERQRPDPGLTEALADAADARAATIVTTDLFYDDRAGVEDGWLAAGAIAVEMEAAAVLAVAARANAAAACLLAVTDELAGGDRKRMPEDEIESLGLELGRVGVAALAG